MHEQETKIRSTRITEGDYLKDFYGQWNPFWRIVESNFDTVGNEAKHIYLSYAGKDFKPEVDDSDVIPQRKKQESLRRNSSVTAEKYDLPQNITQVLNDGCESAMAALANDAVETDKISLLTEPKLLESAFKSVEEKLQFLMSVAIDPKNEKLLQASKKVDPMLQNISSLKQKELKLLQTELQTQYGGMIKQFAKEKKERNTAQVKQMEFLNKLMNKKAKGQ